VGYLLGVAGITCYLLARRQGTSAPARGKDDTSEADV